MTRRHTNPAGVDLATCDGCGGFVTLEGPEERRAEDAAWFETKHRRCEQPKEKR